MIRLAYSLFNGTYSAHAESCRVVTSDRRSHVLMRERFASVAEARAWADAQESEKDDKPLKALFKVCKCAKEGYDVKAE